MQKITIATVKSFVRKNKNNLFIKVKSRFDGMTDGVEPVEMDWEKVNPEQIDFDNKNTMGIRGVWFVNGSRDRCYISDEKDLITVYNSCGSWQLCIK